MPRRNSAGSIHDARVEGIAQTLDKLQATVKQAGPTRQLRRQFARQTRRAMQIATQRGEAITTREAIGIAWSSPCPCGAKEGGSRREFADCCGANLDPADERIGT